jgi:hypothetical protein
MILNLSNLTQPEAVTWVSTRKLYDRKSSSQMINLTPITASSLLSPSDSDSGMKQLRPHVSNYFNDVVAITKRNGCIFRLSHATADASAMRANEDTLVHLYYDLYLASKNTHQEPRKTVLRLERGQVPVRVPWDEDTMLHTRFEKPSN